MSKMSEYIDSSVGYDMNGLPASTTHFTFGFTPFSIGESEDIAELTEIKTIVQTDAIVDLQIIDNIVQVTFNFENDTQTLVDFTNVLIEYRAQHTHTIAVLNDFLNQLSVAQRNEDYPEIESISLKMRSLSIPFLLPTIIPIEFGGSVNVSFSEDPKFVFFTSDDLNQMPYKITMIFDLDSLFAEDEIGVYSGNAEDEIRMQQEEMFYAQEQRRLEEEMYQEQFGAYQSLYEQSGQEQSETSVDNRLKGVRLN